MKITGTDFVQSRFTKTVLLPSFQRMRSSLHVYVPRFSTNELYRYGKTCLFLRFSCVLTNLVAELIFYNMYIDG